MTGEHSTVHEPSAEQSRLRRILRDAALVLFGALVLGFLLFVGAWSLLLLKLYWFLFAAAAAVAAIIGYSGQATPSKKDRSSDGKEEKIPRLIYSSRRWVLVSVTVILGSGLAAAVILSAALDWELIRRFCIPISGTGGDVQIDDNDSCNYDYAAMWSFFLLYMKMFIAPFATFAVVLLLVRFIRRYLPMSGIFTRK